MHDVASAQDKPDRIAEPGDEGAQAHRSDGSMGVRCGRCVLRWSARSAHTASGEYGWRPVSEGDRRAPRGTGEGSHDPHEHFARMRDAKPILVDDFDGFAAGQAPVLRTRIDAQAPGCLDCGEVATLKYENATIIVTRTSQMLDHLVTATRAALGMLKRDSHVWKRCDQPVTRGLPPDGSLASSTCILIRPRHAVNDGLPGIPASVVMCMPIPVADWCETGNGVASRVVLWVPVVVTRLPARRLETRKTCHTTYSSWLTPM